MRNISKTFWIVLATAFIFRIVIMMSSFQFTINPDILRYRDWGRISYLNGLNETYKPDYLAFGTYPNNMPPGSLYSVASMYDLNILVSKILLKITGAQEGSLQWMNGPLLNAFLRLPCLIADLIISILIYLVVKSKRSENRAILSSCLILFNPVIFYNSAFWGQMDSLNNLFFYLALFLIYKKQYFRSILSFFLSIYIKLSVLFVFPVFILLFYKLIDKKKVLILSYISLSIIIILILTMPISVNPISWFIDFFSKNSLSEMPMITVYGFNFWWFLFMPWIESGSPNTSFSYSLTNMHYSPFDSTIFFGLSLFAWSFVLFGVFLIPIIYKILKTKKKDLEGQNLFLFISLTIIIGFLFISRMHERYLYPLFPVLATYVGFRKKYLWVFISLSILNFINLYIAWHPMKLFFLPYELINDQSFQWLISASLVLVGLTFYQNSLTSLRLNEKPK